MPSACMCTRVFFGQGRMAMAWSVPAPRGPARHHAGRTNSTTHHAVTPRDCPEHHIRQQQVGGVGGELVGVVKLAACRFCKKLAPNAVAVESNGCALDLGSGLRVVAGLWRQQLSVRSN